MNLPKYYWRNVSSDHLFVTNFREEHNIQCLKKCKKRRYFSRALFTHKIHSQCKIFTNNPIVDQLKLTHKHRNHETQALACCKVYHRIKLHFYFTSSEEPASSAAYLERDASICWNEIRIEINLWYKRDS